MLRQLSLSPTQSALEKACNERGCERDELPVDGGNVEVVGGELLEFKLSWDVVVGGELLAFILCMLAWEDGVTGLERESGIVVSLELFELEWGTEVDDIGMDIEIQESGLCILEDGYWSYLSYPTSINWKWCALVSSR